MYVESLFIYRSGDIGRDIIAQGVGVYNRKEDDVTVHAYYQWVPFVLFMQACMFYAPHLLCKTWEGGKVILKHHTKNYFYVFTSGNWNHFRVELNGFGQG